MAQFFQRLSKVFQSQAHDAVSKMEDPIKLTEQGIRDLKANLTEAMTSLAQVKALALRQNKEAEDEGRRSADYERKAIGLLQRAKTGELERGEADRLASEALRLKGEADTRGEALKGDYAKQQAMADALQTKVNALRRDVSRYENELLTLRARAKTATSVKKINQHLAGADASDTIAMLERMREKVEEEEALAEAYGQLSPAGASSDDEIDRALATPVVESDSLADLKKRLGMADEQS